MNKQSQIQFVIWQLIGNGFIDNVSCIKHKILRLASRINDIRDLLEVEANCTRDYVKRKLLWTDDMRDVDRNCHYYASKECIKYLKLIK